MSSDSTAGAKTLPPLAIASSPWGVTLIALGAVIATLAVVYSTTISSAVSIWINSETHQFSMLVLPMTLYLIWERRARLKNLRPSASYAATLLCVPFGMLWLVADVIDLSLGTQVAVLGMLQAALLSLLGWLVYRRLLFPLLFLWLLVPFGDFLTPHLMRLTTQITAGGVSLFGLNVTTDGNIVISEAGRVGIVAECSALDFLIGNLVLSLFYANLVYEKPGKRIVYVAVGLLLAIVANNVRTISVIMITYWSAGEWDLLSDHRLYGWLIFLLFVVAQMLVGARFKDPHPAPPSRASVQTTVASANRRRPYLVMSCLTALLVLPPSLAVMARSDQPLPQPGTLDGPAWLKPAPPAAEDWQPVFAGAQAELFASHPVDDQIVHFYVAYYWRQHADAELIGWPNAVYDRKNWQPLEQAPQVALIEGEQLEIAETRLRGPQRARRLTWHWYWVDQQFTANPLIAKLLQAKATLFGGDTRAAVVVLSFLEQPESRASRRAMQQFIDQASFLQPMLTNAAELQAEPAAADSRR